MMKERSERPAIFTVGLLRHDGDKRMGAPHRLGAGQPKPGPRGESGVAYDSARGRVVFFGGSHMVADTWEWDGTAWKDVTSAARPSPPKHHCDGLRQRAGTGRPLRRIRRNERHALADTWEWNGTSWQDVTTAVSPAARAAHGMAYDSRRGRTVVYGRRELRRRGRLRPGRGLRHAR